MGIFKPNVKRMIRKKNVIGLIKALNHKDQNVRRDAAFSLGTVGNAQAVQPLITALGSRQWSICKAAATSLGQITKRLGDTTINARVVEQLIAALNAPSYLNQNEVSRPSAKR